MRRLDRMDYLQDEYCSKHDGEYIPCPKCRAERTLAAIQRVHDDSVARQKAKVRIPKWKQ